GTTIVTGPIGSGGVSRGRCGTRQRRIQPTNHPARATQCGFQIKGGDAADAASAHATPGMAAMQSMSSTSSRPRSRVRRKDGGVLGIHGARRGRAGASRVAAFIVRSVLFLVPRLVLVIRIESELLGPAVAALLDVLAQAFIGQVDRVRSPPVVLRSVAQP